MASQLSRELIKAHNATSGGSDIIRKGGQAAGRPTFGTKTTVQSDSTSMASGGTGRVKLLRLKHKLKFFGTLSKTGSDLHRHGHHLENSYRTAPLEGTEFVAHKAEKIIHDVLEAYLKDKSYDSRKFPNLCKSLAELIKERVKASGCVRYKLVSHVLIMENSKQGVRHVSRCLWNKEFDNFATATYETNEFTAVGSIFGAYYD